MQNISCPNMPNQVGALIFYVETFVQSSNLITFCTNNFLLCFIGLASWIFCFITSLLGVLSLYAQSLKRFIPPVYLKLFHNLTGLAAYTTGIASLILGLDKRIFAGYVSKEHKDATVFWISAITVFSVLAALRSMYNQLQSLF